MFEVKMEVDKQKTELDVNKLKIEQTPFRTFPVSIDCFMQEEEESKLYPPEEILELYEIYESQLATVLHFISEAKTSEGAEDIMDFDTTEIVLPVMEMKRLNRLDKHNLKRSCDILNQCQLNLTTLDFKYQNLLKENFYLEKQITACLEYKSLVDEIDLLPLEEFYRDTVHEEMMENDDHGLTFARLQYEIKLRNKLVEDLNDSEIDRDMYKKNVKRMKKEVLSNRPMLDAVLETVVPLQEKYIPLQEPHTKRKAAKFLPAPLYCLYCQASTYRELYDKTVQVSIEGSVAEAKSLLVKVEDIDTDEEVVEEDKKGEDKEGDKKEGDNKDEGEKRDDDKKDDVQKKERESEKKEREDGRKDREIEKRERESEKREREGEKRDRESDKREREGDKRERESEKRDKEVDKKEKEREQKEKEEEEKRKREERKAKKLARRRRRANLVRQENEPSKKHPLKVHLSIVDKEIEIHLEFAYLYNLRLVTVYVKSVSTNLSPLPAIDNILSPDTIFNYLFPGDNGNKSSSLIACTHSETGEKIEIKPFSHVTTGWPYAWVQKIAGLSFPQLLQPESSVGKCFFRTSLDESVLALKARLRVRAHLNSQMHSIVPGLKIPDELAPFYPSNVHSQLVEWRVASWEEILAHPSAVEFLKSNVVNEDAMLYKAVIVRESVALTSLISIFPDYPEKSPVFLLFLHWGSDSTSHSDLTLKELEKEVNIYCVETIPDDGKNDLLIHQIHHLRACFDIFVEAELFMKHSDGSRSEACVTEICRGPRRYRPYQFVPLRQTS